MKKLWNTKIRILAIFLVLVASLLAVSISIGGCEKIQGLFAPNSSLPHSTLEEQGMDSQVLLELLNFTDRLQGNLHSLLIVRNGKIVLEVYYPPFGPQDKHMLFSATKSFVSAVVGIAQGEGKIQGVDQPVLDYFPGGTLENPDERKQEMHLHDLLNMTSGLLADDEKWGRARIGALLPSTSRWSLNQEKCLITTREIRTCYQRSSKRLRG